MVLDYFLYSYYITMTKFKVNHVHGYAVHSRNSFAIKSAEVITGKKNDLLHIHFTSSNWVPCESVYKFKDGKRHKRSFNARLSANGVDYLMYNIKNKRNDKFSKCKCRHRSDGQLMIEDTIL